ncbi:hypothetical protein CERSUDRAFT_78134 [Gelatoporia subvermispora B]|uniref:SRCR domain-containing protein n=1 Tax=Ceriporiopsis subvermispora (strain B) TaxID=914234 RepID=M2Q402_CERS8|nr:hypothetical protein CERSUDRAFT_78134 [Gelatoporia subvermispora B]
MHGNEGETEGGATRRMRNPVFVLFERRRRPRVREGSLLKICLEGECVRIGLGKYVGETGRIAVRVVVKVKAGDSRVDLSPRASEAGDREDVFARLGSGVEVRYVEGVNGACEVGVEHEKVQTLAFTNTMAFIEAGAKVGDVDFAGRDGELAQHWKSRCAKERVPRPEADACNELECLKISPAIGKLAEERPGNSNVEVTAVQSVHCRGRELSQEARKRMRDVRGLVRAWERERTHEQGTVCGEMDQDAALAVFAGDTLRIKSGGHFEQVACRASEPGLYMDVRSAVLASECGRDSGERAAVGAEGGDVVDWLAISVAIGVGLVGKKHETDGKVNAEPGEEKKCDGARGIDGVTAPGGREQIVCDGARKEVNVELGEREAAGGAPMGVKGTGELGDGHVGATRKVEMGEFGPWRECELEGKCYMDLVEDKSFESGAIYNFKDVRNDFRGLVRALERFVVARREPIVLGAENVEVVARDADLDVFRVRHNGVVKDMNRGLIYCSGSIWRRICGESRVDGQRKYKVTSSGESGRTAGLGRWDCGGEEAPTCTPARFAGNGTTPAPLRGRRTPTPPASRNMARPLRRSAVDGPTPAPAPRKMVQKCGSPPLAGSGTTFLTRKAGFNSPTESILYG